MFLQGCKAYYRAFYTDPDACFAGACINKPYDVIIVPGFPSDSGKINGVLAERIGWACYLYKNGFTKHIIFSGSAVYTPYIESEVMRLYAIQIGIPAEVIFTETNAEHTTENLYYGYRMARDMGFKKIAFASQAAQTSFMKPFRRKFKLQLDMLPLVTDSLRKYAYEFKSLSAIEALKSDFVSIEKRENMIQRYMGTRGSKVKQAMRKERRIKKKE
jgi:uncharacterized SAM-binding protein YcdF (DUF218 family)